MFICLFVYRSRTLIQDLAIIHCYRVGFCLMFLIPHSTDPSICLFAFSSPLPSSPSLLSHPP